MSADTIATRPASVLLSELDAAVLRTIEDATLTVYEAYGVVCTLQMIVETRLRGLVIESMREALPSDAAPEPAP